jgi:hypothetical protein
VIGIAPTLRLSVLFGREGASGDFVFKFRHRQQLFEEKEVDFGDVVDFLRRHPLLQRRKDGKDPAVILLLKI